MVPRWLAGGERHNMGEGMLLAVRRELDKECGQGGLLLGRRQPRGERARPRLLSAWPVLGQERLARAARGIGLCYGDSAEGRG